MHQKVQKTLFFVTLPKLKIFIKNGLRYRKRTRKVHLHIRFSRSKSPVKGLEDEDFVNAKIATIMHDIFQKESEEIERPEKN
jgi:hypothetical protein